jgi:hypothetical protein
MSIIRALGRFHTDFCDMPIWAQLIVILCFCALVIILVINIGMETSIYRSSPSVAVPATGQIYPMHVMRSF